MISMPKRIIDSHTHIVAKPGYEEELVLDYFQTLRQNKIDEAVLVPVEGLCSNTFVKEIYKKNSQKIKIYYNWAPCNISVNNWELSLIFDLCSGIKLHPRLHGYTLKNNSLKAFLNKTASVLNLPILIDGWFSENDSNSSVADLFQFVKEYSHLKILIAHCGGFKYDQVLSLSSLENVYFDTSYILNVFNKYNKIELISDLMMRLRGLPVHKILFGSDYPTCDIKDSVSLLNENLANYKFSLEEREQIFYSNIKRLHSDS